MKPIQYVDPISNFRSQHFGLDLLYFFVGLLTIHIVIGDAIGSTATLAPRWRSLRRRSFMVMLTTHA